MHASWMMFLLAIILGQGRGDLLDTIPTDAYWSAKGITPTEAALIAQLQGNAAQPADISKDIQELGANEYAVRAAARSRIAAMGPAVIPQLKKAETEAKDPEIIGACRELAARMTGDTGAGGVRRLMAIRALGEKKVKSAVEPLKALEKSKDLFVAEYAARALAQIEGRPLPPAPDAAARREADIWLLPANTGIVGQVNSTTSIGLTLASLIEKLPADRMAGMQQTREQVREKCVAQLLTLAEKLGNVRLDSLTLGVANDVGDRSGWAVFIASGSFEPESLGKLLAPQGPPESYQAFQKRMEGSITVYESRMQSFLIEGNSRLVMVVGPDQAHISAASQKVLEAIQGKNKEKLADNADMAKLIRQVDRTQPVWAVARISETMRTESGKAPLLAGFDSFSGTAWFKDGALNARITGQGAAKESMQVGINDFNKQIQRELDRYKNLEALPPSIEFFMDLLKSLKIETTGDTAAALTGQLKLDTLAQMISREVIMGMVRYNDMLNSQRTIQPGPRPGVAPGGPAPAEQGVHEDVIIVPTR